MLKSSVDGMLQAHKDTKRAAAQQDYAALEKMYHKTLAKVEAEQEKHNKTRAQLRELEGAHKTLVAKHMNLMEESNKTRVNNDFLHLLLLNSATIPLFGSMAGTYPSPAPQLCIEVPLTRGEAGRGHLFHITPPFHSI